MDLGAEWYHAAITALGQLPPSKRSLDKADLVGTYETAVLRFFQFPPYRPKCYFFLSFFL